MSSTLYLDTSGDPGWPSPYGKSRVNWYIVAGMALTPNQDQIAQIEICNILGKYIDEKVRNTYPEHNYEIHYHDIIFGQNIYSSLEDFERKNLSDEIFNLLNILKPKLFATAINKTQLKRVYGLRAIYPRSLGTRATIHRYSMFLERVNQIGYMVIDEEEYRKDKELKSMIHESRRKGITLRGENYQPFLENKLKNILNNISFTPSHQSAGLQLADVCSRVTMSHFEKNKSIRFNQLEQFWDQKDSRIYEPSIFPLKSKWI